jgi:hypothetical protein
MQSLDSPGIKGAENEVLMIPVAVQPPTLHPWILIDPVKEEKMLDRQAFTYDVLSKIAFVAIAAICLSVLAISFVLGSPTGGAVPFVLVGLIFSTPFLAVASSKLQSMGKEVKGRASVESSVTIKYNTIKDWQEPQIQEFLNENGVDTPPEIPLRTFLPLIARFQAQSEIAIEDKHKSDRMLDAARLHRPSGEMKESECRTLRLSSRHIGWQTLEENVGPAALDAALALHILAQPHYQLQISNLGYVKSKSFEERQFDRTFGPDDHYFVFRDRTRPPLALRELQDALFSPQFLRDRLFHPAIA